MQKTLEWGPLKYEGRAFGRSVDRIPLKVISGSGENAPILLLGSIHGDESLTSVLLSETLRQISAKELKAHVVLSANPDGILNGTRCNANGVDLNRNFPAQNWSSEPVYYRNRKGGPQDIALSPGSKPGSEPETRAIMKLVKEVKPELIVSFHGFLGCIDDPEAGAIARDLAERTDMILVPDVGYSTPGSFGSWCAEQNIPIITYEIPDMAITELRDIHRPVIMDLLTGKYQHLLDSH